ncbi:hypothetical protein [Streptomyces broussonetiae]|uniref:hypothetical protein n=1 Tax=Streptomyces broussonetiae TaxID=2686304 RepID=UPI0035DB24EF
MGEHPAADGCTQFWPQGISLGAGDAKMTHALRRWANDGLMAVLRQHLDTFATAEDGRLFTNERGGVVGSSTYYRVRQESRALPLPPAAATSPLAARPYDLRHPAPSTCLNSGVDPAEVAERAGNSVGVLLSRYAKWIDGREETPTARSRSCCWSTSPPQGQGRGTLILQGWTCPRKAQRSILSGSTWATT